MSGALKLAVVLALPVVGYLLCHRLLPAGVAAAGRVFGFSMKPSPLTAKRINRFRRIRRGYWSFVAVTTAFGLCFFLELLVNHRPLYVRFGDRVMLPAVADWLDTWVPGLEINAVARASDFGLEGESELRYRDFARWVGDPGELERDAARIEKRLREDERRFRETVAEAARQKGEEVAPDAPLPDFKEEEYARERKRAETLRGLVPVFESDEVGIVLTLHPYSADEQLLNEFDGPPPHRAFTSGIPLLGTDFEGKEVLSQILYGFRISFAFAVMVAFAGFGIGIAVGATMGYFGGWVDILTQRFIEIWSAIPFLYTLMILASITQPSLLKLTVLLVVLTAWLNITYTIRGEFYREKARDYVQAARALGVRSTKIMARHIFPNALVPVVTFLPFALVGYIDSLVALDYLGFGLPPGTPSWGALLRQGADNISNYPELVLFPICALALTLFAVVMIGEAVREAFDPKLYSRLR